MKLKNLVSELESIETFENPKDYLEQYQTEPQVAGEMFHYISEKFQGDLRDYRIADLGCGTGILGISAALCGCENVTLYEIDQEAMDIAKQNVENLSLENNIQLVLVNVNHLIE